MSARKAIRGKIAAAVDETKVVINRGARDGVTRDMKFAVYLTVPTIRDPEDPSNVLDGVRYKKATITAKTVRERMSFCAVEGRLTDLYDPDPWDDPDVKMIYPKVKLPLISPDDWAIQVGDSVEEVQPSQDKPQ